MIVYLRWFHWRLRRPSLLLEEKVPQAAAWGGCGVRYTVAMIETFRRKRTAVTPHQSRFARQLLPKARFAVLKEKPLLRISLWWNQRTFLRETILYLCFLTTTESSHFLIYSFERVLCVRRNCFFTKAVV